MEEQGWRGKQDGYGTAAKRQPLFAGPHLPDIPWLIIK